MGRVKEGGEDLGSASFSSHKSKLVQSAKSTPTGHLLTEGLISLTKDSHLDIGLLLTVRQVPHLLPKAAAQLQCTPVSTAGYLVPSSLHDGHLMLKTAKYFPSLSDLEKI